MYHNVANDDGAIIQISSEFLNHFLKCKNSKIDALKRIDCIQNAYSDGKHFYNGSMVTDKLMCRELFARANSSNVVVAHSPKTASSKRLNDNSVGVTLIPTPSRHNTAPRYSSLRRIKSCGPLPTRPFSLSLPPWKFCSPTSPAAIAPDSILESISSINLPIASASRRHLDHNHMASSKIDKPIKNMEYYDKSNLNGYFSKKGFASASSLPPLPTFKLSSPSPSLPPIITQTTSPSSAITSGFLAKVKSHQSLPTSTPTSFVNPPVVPTFKSDPFPPDAPDVHPLHHRHSIFPVPAMPSVLGLLESGAWHQVSNILYKDIVVTLQNAHDQLATQSPFSERSKRYRQQVLTISNSDNFSAISHPDSPFIMPLPSGILLLDCLRTIQTLVATFACCLERQGLDIPGAHYFTLLAAVDPAIPLHAYNAAVCFTKARMPFQALIMVEAAVGRYIEANVRIPTDLLLLRAINSARIPVRISEWPANDPRTIFIPWACSAVLRALQLHIPDIWSEHVASKFSFSVGGKLKITTPSGHVVDKVNFLKDSGLFNESSPTSMGFDGSGITSNNINNNHNNSPGNNINLLKLIDGIQMADNSFILLDDEVDALDDVSYSIMEQEAVQAGVFINNPNFVGGKLGNPGSLILSNYRKVSISTETTTNVTNKLHCPSSDTWKHKSCMHARKQGIRNLIQTWFDLELAYARSANINLSRSLLIKNRIENSRGGIAEALRIHSPTDKSVASNYGYLSAILFYVPPPRHIRRQIGVFDISDPETLISFRQSPSEDITNGLRALRQLPPLTLAPKDILEASMCHLSVRSVPQGHFFLPFGSVAIVLEGELSIVRFDPPRALVEKEFSQTFIDKTKMLPVARETSNHALMSSASKNSHLDSPLTKKKSVGGLQKSSFGESLNLSATYVLPGISNSSGGAFGTSTISVGGGGAANRAQGDRRPLLDAGILIAGFDPVVRKVRTIKTKEFLSEDIIAAETNNDGFLMGLSAKPAELLIIPNKVWAKIIGQSQEMAWKRRLRMLELLEPSPLFAGTHSGLLASIAEEVFIEEELKFGEVLCDPWAKLQAPGLMVLVEGVIDVFKQIDDRHYSYECGVPILSLSARPLAHLTHMSLANPSSMDLANDEDMGKGFQSSFKIKKWIRVASLEAGVMVGVETLFEDGNGSLLDQNDEAEGLTTFFRLEVQSVKARLLILPKSKVDKVPPKILSQLRNKRHIVDAALLKKMQTISSWSRVQYDLVKECTVKKN